MSHRPTLDLQLGAGQTYTDLMLAAGWVWISETGLWRLGGGVNVTMALAPELEERPGAHVDVELGWPGFGLAMQVAGQYAPSARDGLLRPSFSGILLDFVRAGWAVVIGPLGDTRVHHQLLLGLELDTLFRAVF